MWRHTCTFDGREGCRACILQRGVERDERTPHHASAYERAAQRRRATKVAAARAADARQQRRYAAIADQRAALRGADGKGTDDGKETE